MVNFSSLQALSQGTTQNTGITTYSKSDNNYASKTYAAIKRDQWNDYKEKYPAIHAQYLDMSINPDFTLEQVNRVEGNVRESYARANAERKASLSRMGVQDTAQDSGLAEALSVAHGENATRQHGKERRMSAIGGGPLPSLQTQTV